MHPNKILTGLGLAVCMVALTACASYEDGFEYQSETSLDPVHGSGVKGTAILGLDMRHGRFRMRIALHGLDNDKAYRVRFFDAPGCSEQDLAHADRVDGTRYDSKQRKGLWGFDAQPVTLTGGFFGTAKKDFEISAPSEGATWLVFRHFPAVVIDAPVYPDSEAHPGLKQVACGKMPSSLTRMVPHT